MRERRLKDYDAAWYYALSRAAVTTMRSVMVFRRGEVTIAPARVGTKKWITTPRARDISMRGVHKFGVIYPKPALTGVSKRALHVPHAIDRGVDV